jgi:competence protein ComEC
MQPSRNLILRIAVGITWISCLLGFSFKSGSHWSLLIVVLIVSFTIATHRSSRHFVIIIALVGFLFCTYRLELARDEAEKLISALSHPALFEIAGDPKEFATFDGQTYVVSANVQTSQGELLVQLSNPSLSSAKISTIWSCNLDVEMSPLHKRYRAFARCLDEPKMFRDQVKLQFFGDTFRSTLQGLTSGRYDSLGAQLLPGLVVGDTSKQTVYLEDTLRESGLGHLTAVSGANVAILLVAVGLLLQRARCARSFQLIVLLGVLGAYLVVVRPEPSVVRASVMAVVALAYWFLRLQKHGESILLMSVLTLLFIDPWLALSWGFALSVAATFGLIVLPKVFGISTEDHWLKKAIGVALSAGIATFPVLVAMGSNPSFASILANVLAEVFVAPATILGLLAAVVGVLGAVPGAGDLFYIIAMFIADSAIASAQIICWIAEFALRSWLHIPVLSIAGLILAMVGFLVWRKSTPKTIKLVSGVVATFILITVNVTPSLHDSWTLASCDVGQGDSTLIRTGQHSAVMVDTGDDQELLRKCLQAFDIHTVETLVITHMHHDHFGAFEVLKSFHPGKVIIPSAYVEAEVSGELHEVFSEVIVGSAGYQEKHSHGTWKIVQVGGAGSDSGTDINNSGIVVVVSSAGVNALLLADVEIEAQAKLVKSVSNWNVHLVKIAHHGSRYQYPQLARALNAQFGWVSVGAGNTYGHPHPEMISLYKSVGTRLYSTARCGHLYVRASTREVFTAHACDEL